MTERTAQATDIATPGAARLAVLGSPIAHSRSPRIHRAAYEVLGLPWEYEAVECTEAELAGWLAGRSQEWRGLSLTMPLKEEAHRLATVLDPVAEQSGVVNTLMHLIGDAWAGFNTDVGGLAAAIREAELDASNTLVIGSGATAVSAVLAARSLGARSIEIVARNTAHAFELADRFCGSSEPGFDEQVQVEAAFPGNDRKASLPLSLAAVIEHDELSRNATLVISTLPGAAGHEIELPTGLSSLPLFDVAYDPWPSPLAARWRAAGGEAHSGLGMLIHQALLQIRIFVGGDPALPLEREDEVLVAMRAAVGADMGE